MSATLVIALFMTLAATATPILIAALGELVVEKSGVINIGIDGMMLIGAVVTLIVIHQTGNYALAVCAAALAGIALAGCFGLLTVQLGVNQIIAGLSLYLFGEHFSELIGKPYVGRPIMLIGPVFPEGLAQHSVLKLVFGHGLPVYFSILMVLAIGWFLNRTKTGVLVRAAGEDHDAVHAMGHSVARVRLAAVMFGGAMAGMAGSCFPLMLIPQWSAGLTSGRGWIALALVIFSIWRPFRLLGGAYFFAIVLALELYSKAGGPKLLPPEAWAALPYAATLAALVAISSRGRPGASPPANLGVPFKPPS